MLIRVAASIALVTAVGAVAAVNPQSPASQIPVVKARGRAVAAHKGELWKVAVSPDGRMLASSSNDRVVSLWSLPEGAALRTLSGHRDAVNQLAFTPDSRMLAAKANLGKTVSLWSVADGRLVATLIGDHPPVDLAMQVTPDGRHLVTQARDELRVWSLPDGRLEKTGRSSGSLNLAVITPDSRILALPSAWSRDVSLADKTTGESAIALWSLPDLQQVAVLEWASGAARPSWKAIVALAMTPDGATLVAAREHDIVRWSMADRLPAPFASAIEFSEHLSSRQLSITPDGKTLVGRCSPDSLCAWNLEDGRQIAVAKGHSDDISALAVSPDGRMVATGSRDSTVRLWSLPDGKAIAVLEGHRGDVDQVMFTPDGGTLVTGQTSRYEATLKPQATPSFSLRVTKADAVIALWDVKVNPPAFRCYLAKK